MSKRHLDNVPRQTQEIVKVSRIEGNLVMIAKKGSARQISRLHNLKPELRQALVEQSSILCAAKIGREGRWHLVNYRQLKQAASESI